MRTKLLTFGLCATLLATAFGPAHAQDAGPLYADDFSDVAGAKVVNSNGSVEVDESSTRVVHTFVSDDIVGGKLILAAKEDNKSMGPDEKPGVLSLSYESVPISALYSGFVYTGRKDRPMRLPELSADKATEQLKQCQVTFRYKAVNATEKNLGADWNFRFEWDIEGSYDSRIDFGTIDATGKWQTFTGSLSDGDNVSEFISALEQAPEKNCKLVWGQLGEVSEYDDGDTLLIDDLKISFAK